VTIPSIYSGVDQLEIVGQVAPGIFAQDGRCWRMVYENPVGQGGHCVEPVALGWSVEVPKGPDEGVELRTARRRTDGCPSVDNDRGVIGLDEAWNIYGTCLGPRID
jgi:hypothetical protein